MVGAYHINQMTVYGLAQCLTVGLRLDCGIAFDACSQAVVILVAEKKVRYTDFGGNLLFADRLVFQQLQFLRGTDVHDMEAGTRLLRQLHGQG